MAQEGDIKLYRIRPLIARFMVDENQSPLPQVSAMKLLSVVSLDQVPIVIKQFMDTLKDKAIPKESGLSSPSESIPAVESPAGAVS